MKKILLVCSLVTTATTWSQRQMDLSATILSPVDGAVFTQNEMVYFNLQVENVGTEHFLATDSLYIYVEINGDLMTFQPGDLDHMNRTGTAIDAGDDFNFNLPMVFADGYENTSNQMCISIFPMNHADDIIDIVTGNNEDCIQFGVEPDVTGIKENGLTFVQLSPNPANTTFSLSEAVDGNTVQVISIDGKHTTSLALNNNAFDVSSLPNGSYFVNCTVNEVPQSVRLIVAH